MNRKAISFSLAVLICFFISSDRKQIYSDWSRRESCVVTYIISLVHRCLEEEEKSDSEMENNSSLNALHTHIFQFLHYDSLHTLLPLGEKIKTLSSFKLLTKWYSALQMFPQQRVKERGTKKKKKENILISNTLRALVIRKHPLTTMFNPVL